MALECTAKCVQRRSYQSMRMYGIYCHELLPRKYVGLGHEELLVSFGICTLIAGYDWSVLGVIMLCDAVWGSSM